ncbi:hypothetical protein KR093_000453, partial [Drosophila rubida]
KRRRIIIHDSDSDENVPELKATDKGNKDKEVAARKSMDNSKNGSKEIANQSTDKSSASDHKIDLDKTASVEDVSPRDDLNEDDDEDAGSGSDEDHEESRDLDKSCHIKGISVCEVLDSSDEIREVVKENMEDEGKPKSETKRLSTKSTSTLEKNNSSVMETKSHSEDESKESTTQLIEKAVKSNNNDPVPIDQDLISEDQGPIPEPVDNKVKRTSKSTEFHNKQSHEDDAALLAGLSSCDLSHLKQMFNPLQKSRRQTLYIQGPQADDSEPKPKLKRRSEQLNCDVQPSQSFIETLAEEKRQQSKRKRLSKSFCGAPDDLNASAINEVPSEKPKVYGEISRTNDTKTEVAQPVKSDKKASVSSIQASAGKKPKQSATTPASATSNSEPIQASKAKKTVKRLQAARQAVKHAVNLLAPDTISKEPQTLARKLSPQVDVSNKATQAKKQMPRKRSKVTKASPTKSSDEENQHAIKRIKTSAGYVLMFKDVKKDVELIKTRSGIVKVEPCTPTQKYFKELPPSPQSRSGLHEMPETPKGIKRKPESGGRSTSNRNPATEAALRFKREMFTRNY